MTPAPEEISRWFQNLFEGKAIYRERFIYVIRLEEVEITSWGFSATAVPIFGIIPFYLYDFMRAEDKPLAQPWHFAGRWDSFTACNDTKMIAPYGGWTIWIKPDLVRAVELLLRAGLEKQAIKLLE